MTAPAAAPTAAAGDPAARGRGRAFVSDSLALVVSGLATGALGLAFWAAAARGYPVAEVGRASAVITSAVVLSSVANLSLGAMFERFLPHAGRRAGALVARGHALTSVTAMALGGLFLLLGPDEHLFATGWDRAAFPVLVAALSAFALQDQVAVGLERARWVAVKNIAHSVAKLVGLVLLASTASAWAVVGAWGATAAVAAAVTAVAVRRRLRSRSAAHEAPRLPARRELFAYFGASSGISTLTLVTPLLLPLVVVARLGVEGNAYFAVTWTLVSALSMLLLVVVGPYVAAASSTASPARRAALTRRFATVLAALGVGGGAFLAGVAPFGLALVGEHYREAGAPLLLLMAVSVPLSVVGWLYTGLARVHRRLGLAVLVQAVHSAVVVGGAWVLLVPLGLRGVGVAHVAAEVLTCAVLLVPLARWLRTPGGRRA